MNVKTVIWWQTFDAHFWLEGGLNTLLFNLQSVQETEKCDLWIQRWIRRVHQRSVIIITYHFTFPGFHIVSLFWKFFFFFQSFPPLRKKKWLFQFFFFFHELVWELWNKVNSWARISISYLNAHIVCAKTVISHLTLPHTKPTFPGARYRWR